MPTKTCVITGASRGIGLAAALRFARQKANIVAVARQQADLAAAAEKIRAAGGVCHMVTGDVGEPAFAHALIERAVAQCGRVDVLVNNAGVAPLAAIEAFSAADFDRVVAINMAAIFHTTQAVWPVMKRQGGGVIVNVSSVASLDPFPGFGVYGASKAWVNLFSQAMAAEGRPVGIRVFSVAPGAVETKLMRGLFPSFPADKTLDPDQVAAVIEAVCDDRMGHASGTTVFVRK